VALEAALAAEEVQSLHGSRIVRSGGNPFYVTFSSGVAAVAVPLEGTYELRRIKGEGSERVESIALAKGVKVGFEKGKAVTGERELETGEGLFAWVLVKVGANDEGRIDGQ
jgi:hypothetical protein